MFKNHLRLLFIALLFLGNGVISQTLHQKTKLSSERLERYDNYLQKEIDEGRIAGAVTLIYKNDEQAHQKTLGYSDLDSKAPMKADQIFYIQSMTKPIITTAFMMLYEEGHFLLNDPVEKYLPWFKDLKVAVDPSKGIAGGTVPAKSKITIAMLLSHTSGLSHGIAAGKLEEEIRNAIYSPTHQTIESRIKAMVTMPLIGQPGEQWYYSASPDVLSLLIEYFSGMTTAEFLQKRLFDPLGMTDTGYNLNEEQASRMATLHTYNQEGKLVKAPRQTPTSGNTVFAGANALFSSAPDYAKFAQMLLNGGKWNGKQILSPKTIEIMTIDQIDGLYKAPGQGFGFGFAVMTDLADSNALGSEGTFYWSGAFCTYFFIDPKENLISIMMTQTAPFSGFYEQKMRQMVYQAIE
ncbi:serine hydrolase domain-containing protein [Algoriphagus yeomjeoni]|uniref:CubicO group peptidase (Beta-lactamase class C family) n=1 Tax=Algoriphagus yeomjeoni TaxID=291403 RepID=A0A327PA44_9BACT|nr:serine hydrolase domain-containing protein [Algoriphagus yeomjeoni]RAI88287.1 CubicO group peptidase (beta-lactamase class C family) [Algoriphagus yeomjeoni]